MELSFCLENMLGITSRVLTSKSGVDLAEHARALIYHFQQAGAPVMIGGGQLAHTILGVDYDVRLGKCEFLVLDPHYKGADDVEKVVAGKWCAWRPLTFWDNKAFYNLLLPINPVKKMTDDEKTAKEQENWNLQQKTIKFFYFLFHLHCFAEISEENIKYLYVL